MAQRCSTCQYVYGECLKDEYICGYLVFTGQLRRCSPNNCDKYKKRTKQRQENINGIDQYIPLKGD